MTQSCLGHSLPFSTLVGAAGIDELWLEMLVSPPQKGSLPPRLFSCSGGGVPAAPANLGDYQGSRGEEVGNSPENGDC